METFTNLKDFVDNPGFQEQRERSLKGLNLKDIDPPITGLIRRINELSYCFTLQCCYGHFVRPGQEDIYNTDPLPVSSPMTTLRYRIAYVALCIQEGGQGKALFEALEEITAVDPDYIQFGCAEWFWDRQVNSYALQVEPKRHMEKDTASIGYEEALHLEKVRNLFFKRLEHVIPST